MKKLKLKAMELGAKEILTREQLKKVLGGGGSGSGGGTSSCNVDCTGCSQYKCTSGCTEMEDNVSVTCGGTKYVCKSYPTCWVAA